MQVFRLSFKPTPQTFHADAGEKHLYRRIKKPLQRGAFIFFMWPRQESNLDLELRKLLYYPLYDEAGILFRIFDC